MSITISGETDLFTIKIALSHGDLLSMPKTMPLLIRKKLGVYRHAKIWDVEGLKSCGEKGALWAEGSGAAGQGWDRWEPVPRGIKEN